MASKYLGVPEPKGIITEKYLHNWTYPAVKEKMEARDDGVNDLIVAKTIAIVVLGLGSFILGMLPVKLAKCFNWKFGNGEEANNNIIISLLLCFGGGVLMFTTFLHLQPEVREAVETLIETGVVPEFGHDAKLAELIFCMGFFFVYLIEEIVHGVLDWKRDHNEDEAFLHRTMSLRRCSRRSRPESEETGPTLIPRVSLTQGNDPKAAETTAKSNSTQILLDSMSVSTVQDSNTTDLTLIDTSYSKFSPLDPESQMTGGPLSIYSYSKTNDKSDDDSSRKSYYDNEYRKSEDKANHHRSHSHMLYEDDSNSSSSEESNKLGKTFRGFFTILALSFHAVFEGLAVGLETKVNNVWYLLLAIATHKFVISFCVGVDLLSTRTRLFLMMVYVATFSFVSPLGIGIGIALSDDSSSSGGDLTTVILQGMAAGTLLYVVFFEVLQREKANTQSGVLQLIAIMAGFGVMFALQVITGHEHHHNNGVDVHVAHLVTSTVKAPHSEHDHSHGHGHSH